MTATEHSLATLWKTRTHNLGRMDMADLIWAFVTYPTVHAYVLLALISMGVTIYLLPGASLLGLAIAVALAIVVYPMAWYLIHRFMLHGQYLYKSRWTAAVWKRIHFDHHQDPHDLRVLFGALYTTLPTIAIVTITDRLARRRTGRRRHRLRNGPADHLLLRIRPLRAASEHHAENEIHAAPEAAASRPSLPQ